MASDNCRIEIFPDYEHHISLTTDARPRVAKLRPIALSKRDEVLTEIRRMLSDGIWSHIDKSEWQHAMVIVDKPNGGVRITSDLSALNDYIIPSRFPLPHFSDLTLQLRGARFFSKLDLEKAYYHIALDDESKALTATITPLGLMCYNRLPMGLKDSAAVFQRLVSKALADCPNTIVYVDDIVVHAETKEAHDSALQHTLEALERHDFRLNKNKCIFGATSITFMGHRLSAAGIEVLPERVDPLLHTPQPTSLKELQAFLGAVNYLICFLPQLATLVEPLRQLTRKNQKFRWTSAQTNAYRKVKEAIRSRLPLAIFDPNASTFVTVGASDVGLGAELSQIQEGRRVPIQFASHTLSPAERNYAVNEKEALACLWACEHWEKFFLGQPFTLRTDHNCLLSLLRHPTSTRKSVKFDRWLDRLSRFNYTIKYIKGSQNVMADALSRLPCKTSTTTTSVDNASTSVKRIASTAVVPISVTTIRRLTAADPVLAQVITYQRGKWPPKTKLASSLRPYFHVKNELLQHDNILTRTDDRIVVPSSLQQRILHVAHQGHPGIVRMKRQLRLTYWWPGMNSDIERHVQHCLPCQDSNKAHKPTTINPTHLNTPTKPWSRIAIDIAGPFHVAPQHQRFVTTAIDCFSKFPEILLSNDVTSGKIISWLCDIFARFGNPDVVTTDNSPQFTSAEFAAFLRERDIKHERTAVYNPQQNSVVESFNKYLKHGIQMFQAAHKTFANGITELLFNYRSTSLTPEGLSPADTK